MHRILRECSPKKRPPSTACGRYRAGKVREGGTVRLDVHGDVNFAPQWGRGAKLGRGDEPRRGRAAAPSSVPVGAASNAGFPGRSPDFRRRRSNRRSILPPASAATPESVRVGARRECGFMALNIVADPGARVVESEGRSGAVARESAFASAQQPLAAPSDLGRCSARRSQIPYDPRGIIDGEQAYCGQNPQPPRVRRKPFVKERDHVLPSKPGGCRSKVRSYPSGGLAGKDQVVSTDAPGVDQHSARRECGARLSRSQAGRCDARSGGRKEGSAALVLPAVIGACALGHPPACPTRLGGNSWREVMPPRHWLARAAGSRATDPRRTHGAPQPASDLLQSSGQQFSSSAQAAPCRAFARRSWFGRRHRRARRPQRP